MSNDAVQWVIEDRTLRGADKAVMLALAWRANWSRNGGDEAWPGWTTLQGDSGLSRTAVADALRRLALAQYIYVSRAPGRGSTYYLPTPAGYWCERRILEHSEAYAGAPMGAPGSAAAQADAAAGRPARPTTGPVRETDRYGKRTGTGNGPVRETDPHRSAMRTTPVRQTDVPVRLADPNHKNLESKGNSESERDSGNDVSPILSRPALMTWLDSNGLGVKPRKRGLH